MAISVLQMKLDTCESRYGFVGCENVDATRHPHVQTQHALVKHHRDLLSSTFETHHPATRQQLSPRYRSRALIRTRFLLNIHPLENATHHTFPNKVTP
jgi:hypothetical protein